MKRTLLALALLAIGTAQAAEERPSNAADQTGLAVTIYNGDLALVKDARKVKVNNGDNYLAWRDVSARMQPETALLRSLDGKKLTLLEQNFDFDLLTPQKLLEESVGDSVRVIRHQPITGVEVSEYATVLAANEGRGAEIQRPGGSQHAQSGAASPSWASRPICATAPPCPCCSAPRWRPPAFNPPPTPPPNRAWSCPT
jgi:hypothetical protein